MRLRLAFASLLLVLTACGGAGTAANVGGPENQGAQTKGGSRLLSAEEAVDLARYRSWIYPNVGAIAGVPKAREVLVSRLLWSDARPFLERVDPSGLKKAEFVPPTRKDTPPLPGSSSEVFVVVVRGPVVSDRGKVVADSLAMVVDRHAFVIYLVIGKPWDTVTPPRAQAMPLTAKNKLQDVSLARAQNEIGGMPLVEPKQLPASLGLTQINVNPPGAAVDPTGATFDFTSVTFIYSDQTNRLRLWISQTIFLYDAHVSGTTTSVAIGRARGRRYLMQRDGGQIVAFAWGRGNRSLYLAGEIGADLGEEALVSTAASIIVEGGRPPVPSTAPPS
jgi:hypothetical protein